MDVNDSNIQSLDLTPAEREIIRKLLEMGYTITKEVASYMSCPKCGTRADSPHKICASCRDKMNATYKIY